MQIIVKCWTPEWYDGVTHAVLDVDRSWVAEMLAKLAIASGMKAGDSEFMGLEFDRHDPEFVWVDPETIGMSVEEFDDLSDGGWEFLPAKIELDEVIMRPCMLMVMAGDVPHHRLPDHVPNGRIYWYAYDKHGGAESRSETYSLYEKDLREMMEKLA